MIRATSHRIARAPSRVADVARGRSGTLEGDGGDGLEAVVVKRREKVRERVRRAQDELALVLIDRATDVDRTEGYVVAVGAEWLVLAVLDSAIVLDGHTALRLEDIRRVRQPSNGDMVEQALTLRGQWPPALPAAQLDLENLRGCSRR